MAELHPQYMTPVSDPRLRTDEVVDAWRQKKVLKNRPDTSFGGIDSTEALSFCAVDRTRRESGYSTDESSRFPSGRPCLPFLPACAKPFDFHRDRHDGERRVQPHEGR